MKRTQLVVGAELAYQRRTNDTDSTYGIEKATVLAVEPYEKARRYTDARPVSSGNGVLVKIAYRYQGEVRERTEVVQLSTLVGDYAAEVVRREALYVAEQKRRAEWEVQKAAADAIRRPALAAMMAEIKEVKYVSDYTELRNLPLEVIEAITKALASQKVSA